MFARSSSVIVDSYSARRARKKLPRWLLLLAAGIAAGAGGVLLAQERWLPPRLSAAESARLASAFDDADRERLQLRQQLAETQARLQQAQGQLQQLGETDQARRRELAALREDFGALVDALPPDPRGGAVQVRAARFRAEDGKLGYDIVLTRNGSAPWNGVLQLVLSGSAGNPNASARLEPLPVRIERHASLRGSRPLPAGLADARQVSIQVLDRPQGQLMGMRVMNLR
ncbi:MAG: hypothetical protein LCI02_06405 [Proteobacteria bacterium]|nr:hypothetical protein [Pseudomonadota bacterium]